jgi:hypothetical protein
MPMIGYHPHTVAVSPIPLYLQGMGQEDPTIYDPSGDLVPPPAGGVDFLPSIPAVSPMDTSMIEPGGTLIAPSAAPPSPSALPAMQPSLSTTQLTQLYQSAAAAGTMTPAQAASAIAQLSTGAAAVAQAAAGPAPRVALPAVVATAPNALMSATLWPSSGVPNILLIVGALLAAKVAGDAISGGK